MREKGRGVFGREAETAAARVQSATAADETECGFCKV